MPHYLDASFAGIALFPYQGPPHRRTAYAALGDQAARRVVRALDDKDLYASELLEVELTHIAHRAGAPLAGIDEFLSYLRLVQIDRDVIQRARTLTKALRSLDAIHLATALSLDSPDQPTILLTHDRKMSIAGATHGLNVIDLLDIDRP